MYLKALILWLGRKAPSEEGIYYPATIIGVSVQPDGKQTLICQFDGTNGPNHDFYPKELIGEHPLSSVPSKQLSRGQQVYLDVNGRETLGIIRNNTHDGYYDVGIQDGTIKVNDGNIQVLKKERKPSINNIRNRSQSDISDKRPGRYNRKYYNREYQKNQVSKDEIDVANTLLNFNNIHINYKEATRAEKQQHLNDLSKNPHSVITANPRSDASRVSDEDSTCPSDSMEWHNNQPTARTTQNEETVKTDPEDEVEEIDVVGDSDPLENYDDTDMRDDQMDTLSSSPTNPLQSQILIQQNIQIHQQHHQRTTTPQQISSPTVNSPATGVKLFYMNSSPQVINSPVQARPGSLPAQPSNLVAFAANQVSCSLNKKSIICQMNLMNINTGSPIHVIPQTVSPQRQANTFTNSYHSPYVQSPSGSIPALYFAPTPPPLQTIINRPVHQNRFAESSSHKSPQSAPPMPSSSTNPSALVADNGTFSGPSLPPTGSQRSAVLATSGIDRATPRTPKKPGDGKKCRKIYGIRNRDAWCNACKWKKACVKYPD